MPPRHGAPAPLALVAMAAGRAYCSELSLMVRQLGLWSQLDKGAHRQLRLVCRALHADADALIDTLTLRLDDAAGSSPAAAQRMAAFHRRCPAAQTLHIYLPGGASATGRTVCCAEAYAGATGPLLTVQQCKISGACCGQYHVAMLRSLLGALPQLQGLSMLAAADSGKWGLQDVTPSSAAQLVSVLSDCTQLHSLALDYNILSALPQLTQLRALSLTGMVNVEEHLRCLTRLTRLERLGVGALCTVDPSNQGAPGVQLPSVRTLSAGWTGPLPPPPQPAGSSNISLDTFAYLDPCALRAFPNLQRVERMRIRVLDQRVLSAAHLPALVQRLEGCADLWWLEFSPNYAQITLPALKEQLPHGSLAALHYLRIDCHGLSPIQCSAILQLLLAAAPNIRSLGLHSMGCIPALANELALLQPLKHAAQLQTLLISTYDGAVDAAQLAAVVRYLAAAPPQGPHGSGAHCPTLRCVRVWHWAAESVANAAAALLEGVGCSIRLERGH